VLEHAAAAGAGSAEAAPRPGESARRTRARLEESWIEAQTQAGEFGANFLPARGEPGEPGNRVLAGNRLLQFGTPTDVFGNPVDRDRDDPRGLATMDPVSSALASPALSRPRHPFSSCKNARAVSHSRCALTNRPAGR
jgi:hypothetical protein